MYIPVRVYIKANRSINHWSIDDITPEEVYRKMDTEDTVVYLSVRDDTKTTKNMFDLNFSELLTDTNIGKRTSWGEIAVGLTQALVLGYSTRLPGYVSGTDKPKRGLTAWNIMNVFKTFTVSYADHLSKRADIPAIKWALTDIRIGFMDGAKVYPTLSNSLPIVNGIACKPFYDKKDNYLYGLGGARYSWNNFLPEIGLLDFTRLGNIVVSRMIRGTRLQATDNKDTTVISSENEDGSLSPLVLHRPWECYSPYNLKEYTPVVILAGSIIWPDEIIIDSEHTFRFKLFDKNLNRTRVWAKFCMNEPATNAEVMYKASPILDYFAEELSKPESSPSTECFVIYIHASDIVINRKALTAWRSGIALDLYAPTGVLVKDITHTVHTFYANEMVDRQVLTVQPFEELYLDTKSETDEECMISDYYCQHAELMSVADSSYEMLYVLS